MLNKGDLQEILQAALSRGGDYADIYIEEKKTNAISCEADKIERINSGIDEGAGIRVISGESTIYAYTNDLSKEGLLKAAETTSKGVQGNKGDLNFDLRELKPIVDFQVEQRPDEVSIDDKVDIILRANKVTRGVDNRIKQVTVGYGDVIQKVTIANSDNEYVEDERIRTRFIVNAVAVDGDVIQTGYESAGGVTGFELFREYDPEEIARSAGNRAILMLSAKPAPAGKMEVVMSGEAGGTMVHEACGHGLEADLVQKKLSVYNQKGAKVASDLVTVIDDATLPKKYGSIAFDDEGTPGQKTVLIKNGELVNYMYDKLTARKDKVQSTGNGRRESYQDKPIPRMRNTLIAPGKTDPEKIIRETKSGLLVKKMGGGQVNTTNGDFVFDVAEGFLIRDGEIGAAVRGATLTGNGPEVLEIIDMVGPDLGFTIGTCGKDGQGVPVSDAQPSLHIPEIIVGGTSHGDDQGPQKRVSLWGEPKIRRM